MKLALFELPCHGPSHPLALAEASFLVRVAPLAPERVRKTIAALDADVRPRLGA